MDILITIIATIGLLYLVSPTIRNEIGSLVKSLIDRK